MDAWGVLAFDNDIANDWAYDLERFSDLSLIEAAFNAVNDDYLDQYLACNALAACEVLARLLGRAGYNNSCTKRVDEWVSQHHIVPPPALLKRGTEVIDRILREDSELRELWSEGDDSQWKAAVEDLRRRLCSP